MKICTITDLFVQYRIADGNKYNDGEIPITPTISFERLNNRDEKEFILLEECSLDNESGSDAMKRIISYIR